ncbi:MAG TPA: Mur ligase family protein [Candidatus Woesebacteria bacterium]|nr:Mur ligase family protein [Candidatus Woesebacteria bacterium]
MKNFFSLIFLNYLRLIAKIQLAKIKLLNPKLQIVGITGSAGKTSCLLACEAVLKDHFKVKTNYGGNSESGIPLSILDIKITDFKILDWIKIAILSPIKLLTNWKTYDIFLVEMGIDSAKEPKNMAYLLKIIHPDIGIFLNVTSVHIQNFNSLDNIAQEKARLINSLNHHGFAILNINDPLVTKYTQITLAKKIAIKPFKVKSPRFAFPPAQELTFGAAAALAQIFNITPDFSNYQAPPSRCSLFKGINNSTIIDSSYNSSLLATTEMLAVLKSSPSPRIAVLGDMRELGQASKTEHEKLYKIALNSADLIISVGVETQKYFGPKSEKFLNYKKALDYLLKNLPKNSTILVKGSQNTIFLEELVKGLLADKSDSKLLCRQSPYWQKLKSSL